MIAEKVITILEKDGVLNRQRLAQLKQFTKLQAGNVLDFVSQLGVQTDKPIDTYLREVHKLPVVRIEEVEIDPDVIRILPRAVCFEHALVAFHRQHGKLYVAMADPDNQDLRVFLTRHVGQEIVPYLADRQGILSVLRKAFDNTTQDVQERISELIERAKSLGSDPEVTAKEMPIIKLFDHLVIFALRSKASDLHIEPTDGELVIRLRIDGLLHDAFRLPKQLHAPLIARVKILAKMRIDEHLRPQDARFTYAENGENVAVRVSTVPALYGQKCVLRFLDTAGSKLSLEALGFSPEDKESVTQAVQHPHGLILVTGPTGSGKTTSLYAMLNALRKEHVNISTIEDPVEYHVSGVTQIQVNPAVGLTFATGLRSILRQDPDIILVGEIRDRETADIAINAALTGHVVLSSLHTNTAASAVTRLLDIGVEPYLIASTVRTIVNQRLVRTVCQNCGTTVAGTELPSDFQSTRNTKSAPAVRQPVGCEACFGTGYTGRTGLFEILPMSEQIQSAIMQRATAQEINRLAVKEGMHTLRDDGRAKVLQQVTTPQEILRVAE